jgi:hypothetical protein
MGDMHSFAKRMRDKANRVEPEVARLVKAAAISVVTEVARDTPVKTGQAGSNWLTNIGAPFPYFIADESGARRWTDSVAFAKSALTNYKADTAIHITNNVPYIAELNRGTSRQAPKLFVQMAVLRARYTFRAIKINLG